MWVHLNGENLNYKNKILLKMWCDQTHWPVFTINETCSVKMREKSHNYFQVMTRFTLLKLSEL